MAKWWEAGEVVEPAADDKWWEAGEVVEPAKAEPSARAPAAQEVRPDSERAMRPRPSLAMIGDRATGFRQQVGETGMTPQERMEAVSGLIPIAASFAAGPLIAGGMRAATALPAAQRAVSASPALQRVAPIINDLARSVESGGLAAGLSVPTRVGGGAIAGGAATAVADPEEVLTGAGIGAVLPGAARVARSLAAPKSVTTKELKEQAQEAYKAAESIQAQVSPNQFSGLTYKLEDTLSRSGFNPILHPKANVAVNAFIEQARSGQPVTLNQLDTLRRVTARAAGSKMADEQRIGSALVKDVDDFIEAAIPEAAVQQIEKARELWTRMSRGKTIEAIIKSAQRSGKEPATAIRQKFQRLVDDESKFNKFSEAERDLIKSIAKGRFDVRMLEGMGMLAPPRMSELRTLPGMFTTAGYGGLAQYLGPTKAGVIGGLGFSSRALANRLAMMRAERLAAAVRSGGQYTPRFSPEFAPQLAPVLGVNMLGEPEADMMAEQERINALGF